VHGSDIHAALWTFLLHRDCAAVYD
jgi:hypothetical protein